MIYIGDFGAILIVQTDVDLTGATTIQFKVKKPDTTIVTWPAVVPSGGSPADGIMSYTILTGDLDQSGDYLIQANRIASGINQLGGTFTLKVLEVYA